MFALAPFSGDTGAFFWVLASTVMSFFAVLSAAVRLTRSREYVSAPNVLMTVIGAVPIIVFVGMIVFGVLGVFLAGR